MSGERVPAKPTGLRGRKSKLDFEDPSDSDDTRRSRSLSGTRSGRRGEETKLEPERQSKCKTKSKVKDDTYISDDEDLSDFVVKKPNRRRTRSQKANKDSPYYVPPIPARTPKSGSGVYLPVCTVTSGSGGKGGLNEAVPNSSQIVGQSGDGDAAAKDVRNSQLDRSKNRVKSDPYTKDKLTVRLSKASTPVPPEFADDEEKAAMEYFQNNPQASSSPIQKREDDEDPAGDPNITNNPANSSLDEGAGPKNHPLDVQAAEEDENILSSSESETPPIEVGLDFEEGEEIDQGYSPTRPEAHIKKEEDEKEEDHKKEEDEEQEIKSDSQAESVGSNAANKSLMDVGVFTQTPNNSVKDLELIRGGNATATNSQEPEPKPVSDEGHKGSGQQQEQQEQPLALAAASQVQDWANEAEGGDNVTTSTPKEVGTKPTAVFKVNGKVVEPSIGKGGKLIEPPAGQKDQQLASTSTSSKTKTPTPIRSEDHSSSKPAPEGPPPKSSTSGTKKGADNNSESVLVDLPDVPIERDTRRISSGYKYVSKEQFAIDRALTTAQLKIVRAQIAVAVFDTDDVGKPTTVLRRFWASTGVPKTRAMNTIIADLLNASAFGWPQLYNKWCKLEPNTMEWCKTMVKLQNLAMTACQTSAFRKEQEEKERQFAKENEAIMEKGAQQGLNFAAGVRKSSSSSAASPSDKGESSKSKGDGKKSSNKSSRFDKTPAKVSAASKGGANGTAAETPAAATAPALPPQTPAANKPSLKPPSGRQRITPPGKNVSFESTSPSTSAEADKSAALPSIDARHKVEERRKRDPAEKNKPSAKDRLAKKRDFSLVKLVAQQAATLDQLQKSREKGAGSGAGDATPTPPATPEPDDSGNVTAKPEDNEVDDDSLSLHPSQADMFSPERKPSNSNDSRSQSTSSDDDDVRKIVVESAEDKSGKGNHLSIADLLVFRSRLEVLIDQHNEKEAAPLRIVDPWFDKGRFYIVPSDPQTGEIVLDIIRNKLRLKGHVLRADWNDALPGVVQIKLQIESISERNLAELIEHPKKGLARMNGWSLERQREISYCYSNVDKSNIKIHYVTAEVSKRIAQLIQAQGGLVWISGGQATVFHKNRMLDMDSELTFKHQ